MNFEMNLDSSSSSSSKDEIYDYMLMDFVEKSHEIQAVEDAVRYIVNSTVEGDGNEGSRPRKKITYISRDRESANDRLIAEYFSNQSLYDECQFRCRLRMRKHVFIIIVDTLSLHYRFFQQNPDACMRQGATALQKCTVAIRMLAYGCAADQIDEYLKLGATTSKECLTHFVDGIIAQFLAEYFRKQNTEDLQRLLRKREDRGFPGIIGSIDCMHWEWKNYPAEWKGMYQRRSRTATVILEVVASRDLWIWHAFFGTPGSCNDINVLQRLPVFDDLFNGRAPQVQFDMNGNTYNKGYYLTDGIYPKWATFINTITTPQTHKQRLFT